MDRLINKPQCLHIQPAAGFGFCRTDFAASSSKGRSVLCEELLHSMWFSSKAVQEENLLHFHILHKAKSFNRWISHLWWWKKPNYFFSPFKPTSEKEPGKSGVGIAHVRLHPPPPPISIFSLRRPHFPLIEKSWEIELRVLLTFRLASPGSLSQD